MRVLCTCIVALGLAALPAMAGTGANSDKDSAANGATSTAPAAAPAAKADPASKAEASSLEIENELQQLRDLLENQSKQIQKQNEQLKEQQDQMRALEDQLTAVDAARDSGGDPAVTVPANAAIGPTTGIVSNSATNSGSGQDKPMTPTTINIKGISLTPMGFMAAETVWRQKGLASDVNTPFNSIPFDGSSNAHLSEFQASGRQSRIAMLVEGKLDNVKIGGYYETDFLSAGVTSTPTESNSYTLRQRQFWAQAAFTNGITFTGGQMWSLITETTKGMDNRTEANPSTIDSQYNVGFSWARQYGARITKNFGNKFWLGFSVEQSTPTLTVHGNPTAVSGGTAACTAIVAPVPPATTPTCTTTTVNAVTNNNFLLGAFGTSSGLYNPLGNYGYNDAPDFVVKAVFEPGFGHYEIFGIVGEVHDRVFPCVPFSGTTPPTGCSAITSAAGAFNDSATTGGVGGNARWNLFAKKVELGVHFLGGAGIGRYGSGTLSDLTVRPDGTVVPIHNFQSLGTLILHPTPKLDVYMYVGGEFEERTDYIKSGSAPNEGYGYPGLVNSGCWTETLPIAAPATSSNLGIPTGVGGSTGFIPGALANCTGDTRNLLEGTLGFWYRFYKGPKGTFQYGMQYSNVDRNTWRGVGSTTIPIAASGQPHSDENMVFTSFRYYLP
jgi:hypothetical protein